MRDRGGFRRDRGGFRRDRGGFSRRDRAGFSRGERDPGLQRGSVGFAGLSLIVFGGG